MKPPPLLIGATLLFWGWQSGLLLPGALMAVVIEGARGFRTRWDFSDQDFGRVWTFCALLCLGAAVYAFSNESSAEWRNFLQNPNFATERGAGQASARSVGVVIRWLPMFFFLFAAAQAYSSREGVPLEIIANILRFRWRRSRPGEPAASAQRSVDVSYPYFAVCLVAASAHASDDTVYFWGTSGLMAWALWPHRSTRFRFSWWLLVMAAALTLGYHGQRSANQLSRYLGTYNPEWLTNLMRRGTDPSHSRTMIGQIGRLKLSGKIAIRLDTHGGPPPPYLREASYRTYRAHVWSSDVPETDYADVSETATDSRTYVLQPGKNGPTQLNIGCYLDHGTGLLPLPHGCCRLENLMSFLPLSKSPLGAVMEKSGPNLLIFDTFYGPGATIDSPPAGEDLTPAPREIYAVETVLADLQLKKGVGADAALRTLTAFFSDRFKYSVWQPPVRHTRTNETAITRFLLRTRHGHCEYFATAGALLLRQLGIPARYAVGYSVHEGGKGKYIVRQRDAHAWCLIWNERTGLWQDWDPTPATWVAEEGERASPFESLSDIWSRVAYELSKLRWGQSQARQYVLYGLMPVLLILLYQIIFRGLRRRRQRTTGPGAGSVSWPGLDSEFYQLEARLVRRGLARGPSEPLAEWLHRAVHSSSMHSLREPLLHLLRLHYRYRFDPQGLSPAERDALRREAKTCLQTLPKN